MFTKFEKLAIGVAVTEVAGMLIMGHVIKKSLERKIEIMLESEECATVEGLIKKKAADIAKSK